MGNHKHNTVKLTMHEGKQIFDINWPDYSRNRIRIPEEKSANELMLRIQLAILDGSWLALRQALLAKGKPDLPHGSFAAIADEVF